MKKFPVKKLIKVFLWASMVLFLVVNYIAYIHSYKFTHYSDTPQRKLKVYDTSSIGLIKKLSYIFRGVNVPRPENLKTPPFAYTSVMIPTDQGSIEIWESIHDSTEVKGTLLMFHGYANKKSSLIERANEFIQLNYRVILVDFLGSGGSDGNTCYIGYKEAEQVNHCYHYAQSKGYNRIYMFGISMGSAAIMKCVKDYQPEVNGIILECPFGSMKTTVDNRFRNFGIPSFLLSDLLMLWGSYQTGFWTYNHNPAIYAKHISCPALVLYGKRDHAVTQQEIDQIMKNLSGPKSLIEFSHTGHDIYNRKTRTTWVNEIRKFLDR